MKQNRLNHLSVLYVHKDKLDTLDVDEVAKAFIAKCDSRQATFGRLWQCRPNKHECSSAVLHVDELWMILAELSDI